MMNELPKVMGPFSDRNKRGLPIVMKCGFPAWAYKPIRRADGKTPAQVRATYKRKETV